MTDITLHGTLSEILQHHEEMIGHKLTVIIHHDEYAGDAGPEHLRIRDEAHLKDLLQEGMNSPASPMTSGDWEDIRNQVRDRAAARQNGNHA